MREQKVDSMIVKDLDGYQNLYWRKKQANMYQPNGTADYYGCYRGKYFSIEAKAGNGHPLSPAQLFDGYLVVHSGGIFIVAFPDYTTFVDIPREKMKFEFGNAKKANQLTKEQYAELEVMFKRINQEKRSIMFY